MKDDARAVMAILGEEEQEREWLKQDEEQTEEAGYWEIDGWVVSEEDQEEEEAGGQEQGDARVVMEEPEEEDQEHAEAESGRGSKKTVGLRSVWPMRRTPTIHARTVVGEKLFIIF